MIEQALQRAGIRYTKNGNTFALPEWSVHVTCYSNMIMIVGDDAAKMFAELIDSDRIVGDDAAKMFAELIDSDRIARRGGRRSFLRWWWS